MAEHMKSLDRERFTSNCFSYGFRFIASFAYAGVVQSD